ncbi:MAG: 30S ribosomal protein S16 [Candidatus Omnitrophica bacterium]|jgi:small subunit ribosomal protein S16|nr:30S ribosomal protein S16 [Candidatus Omnitrophota bacterium]
MLTIRLQRPGKSVKRRYYYKMVVIDLRAARDSRFIDELGHYDPSKNLLKIDTSQYESWVKKGAKPTETVASLFKKYKKLNTVVK